MIAIYLPTVTMGVGRLTSLLVVLAIAAVNRLVDDCCGRRIRLDVTTFNSFKLPFSELEKTPLDSVPVEVAICCSCLLFFSLPNFLFGATRPPNVLTVCHKGFDDVTPLELLFELILLADTARPLVLLVVTTRELTSFRSLCRAVGGRIALILMELLKGTALLVGKTKGILLGFEGSTASRRLDIVQELSLVVKCVIYTSGSNPTK